MEVELYANTNGTSKWTDREATEVRVNKIKLCNNYEDDTAVEVRAYIDLKTFRPKRDGLIYTDKGFIREFRQGLVELGVPQPTAAKVDYSEQGMQGKNYVSMVCVGKKHVEVLRGVGFTTMQDPYGVYHPLKGW